MTDTPPTPKPSSSPPQIDAVSPDELMTDFQGHSLVKIVVVTLIAHIVLLGAFSPGYLKAQVFGESEEPDEEVAELSDEEKLQKAEKVNPGDIGAGPQLPLNSRTTYRNHFVHNKHNYRAPRRCTPDLLRADNPNMKKVGQTHNKDTFVPKSIDKPKEDAKRWGIRQFDLKSQDMWFDKTRPIPTEYQHKYVNKKK